MTMILVTEDSRMSECEHACLYHDWNSKLYSKSWRNAEPWSQEVESWVAGDGSKFMWIDKPSLSFCQLSPLSKVYFISVSMIWTADLRSGRASSLAVSIHFFFLMIRPYFLISLYASIWKTGNFESYNVASLEVLPWGLLLLLVVGYCLLVRWLL